MAEKTPKLNSMRHLDAEKIAYEVMLVPEQDYASAAEVAAQLGISAEEVYKTLVTLSATAGSKPALVMIASEQHLNLKRYAASIGQKKMVMATHEEAEKLTGLKVGGIGALALLPKRWSIYLDRHATTLTKINVSAGQRGIMLRLNVADLIKATGAVVIDATSEDD